jgi:hypothetical protein
MIIKVLALDNEHKSNVVYITSLQQNYKMKLHQLAGFNKYFQLNFFNKHLTLEWTRSFVCYSLSVQEVIMMANNEQWCNIAKYVDVLNENVIISRVVASNNFFLYQSRSCVVCKPLTAHNTLTLIFKEISSFYKSYLDHD